MEFISAQNTAYRLGCSKQHLLVLARDGRISPAPTKVGGRNGQWLFSPKAKIINIPLDKGNR